MSITIGIVWGILSALILFITTKYYMPKLSLRSNAKLSDKQNTGSKKLYKIILCMIFIVLFSGICGYYASENATSIVNIVRIAVAFMVLLLAAQTDHKYMIIPNLCSEILLVAGIISIIVEFIYDRENVAAWTFNCIISTIITLIVLLILNRVTKGGIGMGDVKIFSLLSFLCGLRCVFATLMLAFTLCAFVSLFLILLKKKTMKDALPLGPFIYFGYGISIILAII